MPNQPPPKVFLSHASEDKERFVINFAEKLRTKGLDAWLDIWEMLPGDSLVDKIFEEGIKNAQVVIVVLSTVSVTKPWVKEELNAAVVKRIKENCKLIPIIIDDCEIPQVLQSTVWEKIEDLNNYDSSVEKIVNSIFDYREKPPIGDPPVHTQTIISTIQDLTKIDNLVLKLSCEKANEKNSEHIFHEDVLDIKSAINALDINDDDFYESLDILDSQGYIEGEKRAGGNNLMHSFKLSVFGYEEYAQAYIPDYSSIITSVGSQLVNLRVEDSLIISNSINQPLRVVNHILELFEQKGFLEIHDVVGYGDHRLRVSLTGPALKRRLEEQ